MLKHQQCSSLIGIVVPNNWDQAGHLNEVVLCGWDESEHILVGKRQQELFELCHHKINVCGTSCVDASGRIVFDVVSYTVIGNEIDCGYETQVL